MPIQFFGLASTNHQIADVDASGNLLIQTGFPIWSSTGNCFSVAGQTSAVVAASLASLTTLMSMRFSPTSGRKAYVTRMRLTLAVATVGTAGLVPGMLALQRFSSATPSGGTARTVNKIAEGFGASGTDMTDVRDNNAALTVTSVVFGNVVTSNIVPIFITGGAGANDWTMDLDVPIVLNAGDGLCLRTQTAMPATQTWMFSYTIYWYEK